MSWTRCFAVSLSIAILPISVSATAADISVLLPLTGSTAKASESIRDGLLASYYQALTLDKASPSLHFYDTTPYTDLKPLLDIAITPETTLVIGPLLKEHVNQLLENAPNVPVLALNRINTTNGGGVWQFALAPEEETLPLIKIMKQAGIQRVRTLLQADANSERLRQSFEQQWIAQGGDLLPIYKLTQTDNDGLTRSIKKLLAEPETARAQAFYLASPQLSLYAMPLLNFYQRTPIPVYSSSQSYDADKSQLERQDLNGLHFCGLPWLIAPQKWQDTGDNTSINSDRFYAFGADAWTVSEQLTHAKKYPIAGRTGLLNLIDGQVQRTPLCAEVMDGKATLSQTTVGASR
jgi:outer membrane PBP1 activator LpoA protein